MLIEDERVFVEATRQAINILLKFIETDKVEFREKVMSVLKQNLEDVGEIAIQNSEEFKDGYLDWVSVSMPGRTRDTGISSSFIPMRKSSIGRYGSSALSNQSCISHSGNHEESGVFVTMEDF